MAEEVKEKKPAVISCGAVNKQYFVTDEEGYKKPVDVPCELPAGHSGDHGATTLTGKKNRDGSPEKKFYNFSESATK